MSRFLPRSLIGQILLAVAVALLIVQGIGAVIIYRAQSEFRQTGIAHAAAFRIIAETRGGAGDAPSPDRHGSDGDSSHEGPTRGPPVERSARSPLRPNEAHDVSQEARLRAILAEQGLQVAAIDITERTIASDEAAMKYATYRTLHRGRPPPRADSKILVVGVRLVGESDWLIARAGFPRGEGDLIWPLVWQTVLIYLVVVGMIAFVVRRITRPLAALTRRVEDFGETRNPEGRIAPQGPDDTRRLITAHNAMEARIVAMLDEKDVMLGAIGHDLKTPLAALRVRIESVEDDAERARMAATIEDIVETLDDILSLARVGRPTDALERTELSALVASVVEEYEDMGEPVTLAETRRMVLEARPTWIRRALRNLIGNAVRYGERAAVSLAERDGQAIVRIEDEGPGIPETAIAAMMNPFTRGDPSRNSATGGAGLGLALAKAIAEQHGGTLTVRNRLDAQGAVSGLSAELALPIV